MFVVVFGVLLLVACMRRSCWRLGEVRADVGGSGGRRVGKGEEGAAGYVFDGSAGTEEDFKGQPRRQVDDWRMRDESLR